MSEPASGPSAQRVRAVSEGFAFAGLDRHIAFVAGTVVEPLRRAAEAGRPLDHLAYGLVGQVFAVPATVAVALASQAVGELSQAATGFDDGLRATAEEYTATETINVSLLGAPR